MGTRIACRAIDKSFRGVDVLRQATLSVEPGTVLGVIGANGAGKTTLLRILLGLVLPDRGSASIGGWPPAAGLARHDVRYLAGGGALPAQVRVRSWAGLFRVGGELASDRRRLGVLSRGQRQLVGLRVALAPPEPDVVVLDEPWDALDLHGTRWLTERIVALRRAGAAIVVASHRLSDLVDVCDRYTCLRDGALVDVTRSTRTDATEVSALRQALGSTRTTGAEASRP